MFAQALCNLVQPEPTLRCTKPIMSGLHRREQGKVSHLIESSEAEFRVVVLKSALR